ncbi:MAG: TonB-dependent receptor domain-containing protein [Gemmatimonadota bacterium]
MTTCFRTCLVITCSLLLLPLSTAIAQEKASQPVARGAVTGRITDKETSSPLAGATIEAVSSGGRAIAQAVTDADGQFRLTVPIGTHAVVISMLGYQTQRVEGIRVMADASSMLGAALTTEAFLLNPVVVSASKHTEKALEAPAAVAVVSEREIAERPTITPADHLRSVPGVDVMTTGVQSSNVVVRGFNNIFSGALHTLTDYRIAGIPSLRVNFLHFTPQTNDDYARVEVVLGPGSALYGPNTANGVLHIITKSPLDEQGTTVSFAGGIIPGAAPSSRAVIGDPKTDNLWQGTFRTAQKLGENVGFKVSGQYVKAAEFFYRDRGEDSIKAIIDTASVTTIGSTALFPATMTPAERTARAGRIGNRDFDIGRWSGDARLDWRASEKLTTVLSGGITNANGIELTGIGAGQVVDWKYSYAQARAQYGNTFAQTYLNMSDAGETFLLRNGAPITDKSKVWVSQLQHVANLGARQTFTGGVDYISTMPNTEGTINGTREDTDDYQEFGAYVQSETRAHRMLDIVLAGRYDKHSELSDAVFSPRAGLVFKPTEEHNFRATYNRAFSTPTSLNLFLDIDAGPLGALGPFGFRAHAQAPGRQGIRMHDANGNLQIRTPFAGQPSQLVTPSLGLIYNHQVTAIGLAARLPAAVQAYMRGLVADPAFATNAMILLDPLTNKAVGFNNNAVSDISGIEESTTSTYEFGYKGLIGGKLLLAADVWRAKHKNFTSPLIAATPLVMLSPQQLVAFLVPRLTPVVGAASAQTIAQGMARLPGGIVSSAETTTAAPSLILTYINFGDITLEGADVSATALLSNQWQFSVTGSLVSDDFFNLPLGSGRADSTVVALNAPKKKGSAALAYRNLNKGLNGELRVRYTDEFPANSAGYVGLSCVKSAPANSGDCVKSYTLLDLTAGYRLPFTGASLQLTVNNLLDEEYQSFIGTPITRRLALLRLKYDF